MRAEKEGGGPTDGDRHPQNALTGDERTPPCRHPEEDPHPIGEVIDQLLPGLRRWVEVDEDDA